MKHLFVHVEFLCKNCGNKYHLPVWYWKNKIQDYAYGPKQCECGKNNFTERIHTLSETDLGCPHGRPLMAKGEASIKGYKFVCEVCECKKCKSQYWYPMAIENKQLMTLGGPCECGSKKFNVLSHRLMENRKKVGKKVDLNLLMVKKSGGLD